MLTFEPPHIWLPNNSTWTCSKLPFKFPKPQSIIEGKNENRKELNINHNYKGITNINAKYQTYTYVHNDKLYKNIKYRHALPPKLIIYKGKETHLLIEHLEFPRHESNTCMVHSNSLDISMLLVTKRYVSPPSKFTLMSQKYHS